MGRKKKIEAVVDKITAEEKLGIELIDEIASKDWKIAKIPTEEDLAKEKHESPKARANKNSRKNLMQYRDDKPVEAKKKVVEKLEFPRKREDVNPFDYINIPDGVDRNDLEAFLPPRKVFRNENEEKSFYIVINSFLQDFDFGELSASDIEDVVSLALNRVMEERLWVASSGDVENVLEISQALDRIRKHTAKLKENLSSRRQDRIDPRSKQNYSIVDIVMAFDDKKKSEFEQRMNLIENEKNEFNAEKKKRDGA